MEDSSSGALPSITLQHVLNLRNAPFIEPHAWAVAYQALRHFRDLFHGRSSVGFSRCDLSSFILTPGGLVLSQAVVNEKKVGASQHEIRIGLDGFLEALGNQLYDGLCLHIARRGSRNGSSAPPQISPPLENLLNTLRFRRFDEETDSDSSTASESERDMIYEKQRKSVVHSRHRGLDCASLIQICELRFAGCQFEKRFADQNTSYALCSAKCSDVREHYVAVCRSLYAEALDNLRQEAVNQDSGSYSASSSVTRQKTNEQQVRDASKGSQLSQRLSQLQQLKAKAGALNDFADAEYDPEDAIDGENNTLEIETYMEDEDETRSVASSAFTSVSQLHNSSRNHARTFGGISQKLQSEAGFSMQRSAQPLRQFVNAQDARDARSTIDSDGTYGAGVQSKSSFTRDFSSRHSFAVRSSAMQPDGYLASSYAPNGENQSLTVNDRRSIRRRPSLQQGLSFDRRDTPFSSSLSSSVNAQRRRVIPAPDDIALLRDGAPIDEPEAELATERVQAKVAESVVSSSRQAATKPSLVSNRPAQSNDQQASLVRRNRGEATALADPDRTDDANLSRRLSSSQSPERGSVFDSVMSPLFSALHKSLGISSTSGGTENQPSAMPVAAVAAVQTPASSTASSACTKSEVSVRENKFFNPSSTQDANKAPRTVARSEERQSTTSAVARSNGVNSVVGKQVTERGTVQNAMASSSAQSVSAATKGKNGDSDNSSHSARPEIHSRLRSASGSCLELTLEEIAYMQCVACEAELESIANRELYAAVSRGAVCFNCLKTRFGHLFDRGSTCRICSRRVCERCSSSLRVPDTPALFTLPIVFLLESSILQRCRSRSVGFGSQNSSSAASSSRMPEWLGRRSRNAQLFEINSARTAKQIVVCQSCYSVIVENVHKCGNTLTNLMAKPSSSG